jgi:hypothetical protein
MAKRKHTPDMLARQPYRQPSTIEAPEIAAPHSSEPSRSALAPPSDPLTMLFPDSARTPQPFFARVKLSVTAGEELTKEIVSAVSQALESLPDVQLVSEDADWTLMILGVPLQTPARGATGVGLSVIVVEEFDRQLQEWLRIRRNSQPDAESISHFAQSAPLGSFKGAWLRVTAPSQLSRLCQQVVVDFNSRYLEKRRRGRVH